MSSHSLPSYGAPPGASAAAVRVLESVARPLQKFLHIQAASGIVLLFAATLALAWANSPWAATYEHIWHLELKAELGGVRLAAPLHFIVNEVLMVVFFFVVGLEVRREIHHGELSTLRRGALPIFAALGGMIVPAAIYLAIHWTGPTRAGWGIPMATDIAFAVGVLALLGDRVPSSLRVLLLALAIIDDIGAILVIAFFYSSGIDGSGFAIAAGAVVVVVGLQRLGVRHPLVYVVPAIALWAGFLRAGVHPTIAGVILGLMTPVRAWFSGNRFIETAERAVASVREHIRKPADERALVKPLGELHMARREAISPLSKLESVLHPWVAFAIMPIFAFANAGVPLGGGMGSPDAAWVALGVAAGLVLGKPIGVLLAGFLAVRLGISVLPRHVTFGGLTVVGLVAGIGFTMAIFIANLAFTGAHSLEAAKIGVLAASAIAAAGALTLGRLILPKPAADVSVDEAEASDDF